MFILKIVTTVWLTLIALALMIVSFNREADTTSRLLGIAVMFGQILAIAFMWQ